MNRLVHGLFSAPQCSEYSDTFREILHNLGSNKDLALKLLAATLTPSQLASMTPKEMASQEVREKEAAILSDM